MSDNVENLDLSSSSVEADKRLQDMEDLRLAAVEHVLAQVHVQRLRIRRQGVVPAQESSAFCLDQDFHIFSETGDGNYKD